VGARGAATVQGLLEGLIEDGSNGLTICGLRSGFVVTIWGFGASGGSDAPGCKGAVVIAVMSFIGIVFNKTGLTGSDGVGVTSRTPIPVCAGVATGTIETNSAVAKGIIGNRIVAPPNGRQWLEFARGGSRSQWCIFPLGVISTRPADLDTFVDVPFGWRSVAFVALHSGR
jgi:hypothetical protein